MAEKSAAPAKRRGDMTQGNVYKTLLMFAIPTLLTNVLNQLYNAADSVIVGRFVGPEALAAVGSNTMVTMLFVSLFVGAGVGGGVYVAQLMGARKYDEISEAFNCMYCLIALMAAATGILANIFAVPLMKLMNTPANIFDDTVLYFRIYCAALPGLALYSSGSAGLRSLGDARAPLYFLIFSAILNVVLNVLFVAVFRWGVAGVAWATLIAQYCSAAFVVFRTSTTKIVNITVNFKTLRLKWRIVKIIMKLGIPSAMQTCVQSLGSVLVQRYINMFGSDAVAAIATVMRIDGFLLMPVQSIGMSMSVFFGQNLAAKKHDRLHKATVFGCSFSVALSVVLSVLLYIFIEPLMGLFTDSVAVIALGKSVVGTLCYFYWCMGLFNIFSGIMRGAGDTMTVMVVSLIGTILRVPLTYLMAVRPQPMVFTNIFWAMAICNVLMFVLILGYYFTGRWKKKVVVTVDD